MGFVRFLAVILELTIIYVEYILSLEKSISLCLTQSLRWMVLHDMVDIIIPIYNAFEDLQICLDSLYKNTDFDKNRLILINDNSPDERIAPLLDKQRTRKNVIVIHNETNKGFSNNINIGIAQSEENDVILLNSDTIVTDGWIDKMVKCAYSNSAIGTVTPLSNNATLCSVPIFCEENRLPEGVTVERAGKVVEECSERRYPRISVAHGFCMYVKREVIDLIGNFDAETFGRGYGEENDFCNRAEQAGYFHVMCDDTYIYHSGTKSFISKEKEAYIRAHEEILRKRYPVQMHNNDVHVIKNPNHFVSENVGIYLDINNGRRNILYVLQSDFREGAQDNCGGTQIHVRDLVSGMRDSANIFVAARDGDYLNLTVYYGDKEKLFKFYMGRYEECYQFTDRNARRVWDEILSAFKIDLVHVHHVIRMSFDIFYAAKEHGIPLIFTAHDFYFVCPSSTLIDCNGKQCAGKNDCDCRQCLENKCKIYPRLDFMKIWRTRCAQVFGMVDEVILPDRSVGDILLKYYPSIADKLKVIPHGYKKAESVSGAEESTEEIEYNIESVAKEGFSYNISGWAYPKEQPDSRGMMTYIVITNSAGVQVKVPVMPRERKDVVKSDFAKVGFECIIPADIPDGNTLRLAIVIEKSGKRYVKDNAYTTDKLKPGHMAKLNIAFIGGISRIKGGDEIADIIKSEKNDVNWYLFGTIGTESLAGLKQGNLIKSGSYAPETISELLMLHKIDAVGILSIVPETYSYTLTEALSCGIPAIVTDIGALGRRVAQDNAGWTVPVDSIQTGFEEIVGRIINVPEELQVKRKNAANVSIRSIHDMSNEYEQLYDMLYSDEAVYDCADRKFIYEAFKTGRGDTAQEVHNSNAERELEHIKASAGYKLLEKLWALHFPGRAWAERMLKRIMGR